MLDVIITRQDRTYQVVEFNSGHTLVDAGDDLLRDSSGINMLRVKTIAKP
jgi:hypothetical protein